MYKFKNQCQMSKVEVSIWKYSVLMWICLVWSIRDLHLHHTYCHIFICYLIFTPQPLRLEGYYYCTSKHAGLYIKIFVWHFWTFKQGQMDCRWNTSEFSCIMLQLYMEGCSPLQNLGWVWCWPLCDIFELLIYP